MQAATDYGRAKLAECAGIVGGTADPFAAEWRRMSATERDFWLNASRLSRGLAHQSDWSKIPADVRSTLKNNLYRAAKRAETLLRGMAS